MNKTKRRYYCVYTFVFIILSIIVFYVFYSNGKSLIYNADGWTQHYKALIYYSRYLKNIFKNIFINHKFVIPQYDFSIGEGFDILNTFSYYVINDPIAFLSVFVPDKYIFIFYNFSSILRIYLCGIAFSYLCFYKKIENHYAILAGALTYAFCFWNTFNCSRHIFFINPLIYLPFVIVGIDKIIDNQSPYLLSFSVMISAMSNFYYFYNIVLISVIYVAVKLIIIYKKEYKKIIEKLFYIFIYSLIGVLLAGVILLPVILNIVNDARANVSFDKHLLYPLFYYLKLPSTFLSTTSNSYLYLGYSSICLLAIINCILHIKKNINQVVLLIIGCIFICFPIFGQLFNGNTYFANKWSFAFSLLVSYITAKEWDQFGNKKSYLLFILISIVLIVMGASFNIIVPLVLGIISIIIYELINNNRIRNILLLLILLTNISFIWIWHYSEYGSNYVSVATSFEEDYNVFTSDEGHVISDYIDIHDNEFVRYSADNLSLNSSILYGKSSTAFFWSLSNNNVDLYRKELELNEYCSFDFKEYDKRSLLYSLANVKYYLTDINYKGNLPYGFDFLDDKDGYKIYINNNFIPFGYTYDETISYDEWSKLNAIDKEISMSKYMVIDCADEENREFDKANIIQYEIIDTDDELVINRNNITVNKENASLRIHFNVDSENDYIFIGLDNIKFDDDIKWLKKNNASKERSTITFSTPNLISKQQLFSNGDRMYNGRNKFIINLGNNYKNLVEVNIIFGNKGTYSFNDIKVYGVDYSLLDKNLNNLAENTLKNVVFKDNYISGTINADTDKFLLLSIPYTNGFKAYIDQKEVEVFNANVAYLGIKVPSGEHLIELKYETPYLKEGAIMSCIGIICLFVSILLRNKKVIR